MLLDLLRSVIWRNITFALLLRAGWVSSAHQLEALDLAELAEVTFEVVFIYPMRQVLEVQVVPDHRTLELLT